MPFQLNNGFNLAEVTNKFNQRLPEALRLLEKNTKNPYMVLLKDTRAYLGYSPDKVLATKATIPTLDIKQGVEFTNQYAGLAHTYGGEEIDFDKRITNQVLLLPEDAANIGPEANLIQRITTDALVVSQKTANEFSCKVITNNILAAVTTTTTEVATASLTAQYVYKDINEKIDDLVSNGYMPEELGVFAAPFAIKAYNQGRRADRTLIFTPQQERTLMTAAGVQMYSGKATWMKSKYEFKNDSGDSTKKIYEPASDAKQVWYIVAPIEAVYWDIAEAHTDIANLSNSPAVAGSFMERIGCKVREQRKEFVSAVVEGAA